MTATALPIALDARLALVTGAAGGIGAATAQALAAAGARVWLADRPGPPHAACEAAAQGLRDQGRQAWAAALDVTDGESVRALAQRVTIESGDPADLDILVNNAGLLVRRGIDDEQAEAIVRQVMDVNLHGAFAMAKAFLPALRRRRGCIVNVASGAAFTAQARCAGYSASKAALHMLTQTLAVDLGADGVRVNAVAPGVIDTPMTEATRVDAARLAGFVQRTPAGRIGQPAEVAAAIVFLASPLASYVNGVTLPVDGGFLAT